MAKKIVNLSNEPRLKQAIFENNSNAFKRLFLNNRLDINATDELGKSLLHYAAESDHDFFVKFLLKKGANPSSEDDSFNVPRDYASGRNSHLLPINTSQTWLLQRKKTRYPKTDLGGLCQGLGLMGVQAILCEDVFSFNERCLLIHDTPLRFFSSKIEKSIKKRHAFRKRKKPSIIAHWRKFDLDITAVELEEELNAAEQNELPRDLLLLAEADGLFDGIEMHQQNSTHPELFNDATSHIKSIQRANDLISPISTSMLDGISGIYSKAQLIVFFKTLRETMQGLQLKSPFACHLEHENGNGGGHSISIGYDYEKQYWYFIDANSSIPDKKEQPRSFVKYIRDDTTLVNDIFFAMLREQQLKNNQHLALSTFLYGKKSNEAILKPKILAWKNTSAFKVMHTVTKEKTRLKDSRGGTWLAQACYTRELEPIKANEVISQSPLSKRKLMHYFESGMDYLFFDNDSKTFAAGKIIFGSVVMTIGLISVILNSILLISMIGILPACGIGVGMAFIIGFGICLIASGTRDLWNIHQAAKAENPPSRPAQVSTVDISRRLQSMPTVVSPPCRVHKQVSFTQNSLSGLPTSSPQLFQRKRLEPSSSRGLSAGSRLARA